MVRGLGDVEFLLELADGFEEGFATAEGLEDLYGGADFVEGFEA